MLGADFGALEGIDEEKTAIGRVPVRDTVNDTIGHT